MTRVRYVWLVCGLAVLIVDSLGSLAARHWGFGYGELRPLSYIIYFCAGAGGGRVAGIRAGAAAGAITALVDATVGWAISSALGAAPKTGPLPPGAILLVVLGVVITGLGLGLVGGALGKGVHRAVAGD
jgi:hypothetical protein